MSDRLARRLLACALLAWTSAGCDAQSAGLLTVEEAQTLPARELATRLIGEPLGSRVIEAVRREYNDGTPLEVDLFSRPEWPWPRITGICRTDVVTVEYNWADYDGARPNDPLTIVHVTASSRYKAFAEPQAEPGSPESDRAQIASCAAMTSATDAFRAPSTGDAQWLAAIARQYRADPGGKTFALSCRDEGERSCRRAASVLTRLELHLASKVVDVDCPRSQPMWFESCYVLTFPDPDIPEALWTMRVRAGIRDGSAPIEIRSLRLEHEPPPFRVP